MDITEVCKFFPEVCVVLGFAKIIAAVLIAGALVFAVIFWYMGEQKREQKKCPQCKQGFLRAESRNRPGMKPGDETHTYRDFYLICHDGCGYEKKIGEPELVA